MGDDNLAELLLERAAEMVSRLAQRGKGVALVPGEPGAARLAAAAVLVGEDAAIGSRRYARALDGWRQPGLDDIGFDRLDAGCGGCRDPVARGDEAMGCLPRI